MNHYAYRVSRDSLVLVEDKWEGGAISFSVPNSLGVGTYVFTLRVNTTTDRELFDSVTVAVVDTTDPYWTSLPIDATIESGERFSLVLQATDLSGIESFWVNDTSNFAIEDSTLVDTAVLPIGEYPIEVRAYDPSDNYCTAKIRLTVEDTVSPDISHPDDIEFTDGTTGQFITWTFTDSNPDTFEVYLNGTLIMDGIWNETSDSLSLNLDGLDVGTYVFLITITDAGGNSVSDEVTVVVSEVITTTTSSSTTVTSGTSETSTESSITGGQPTDSSPPMVPVIIIGIIAGVSIVILVLLSSKGVIKRP